MCGRKVYLLGNGDPESIGWFKPEYHDAVRPLLMGVEQAEIHHVIPVVDLVSTAWETVKEIDDKDQLNFWYYKFLVMLCLDVNNLTTLCKKPCHDIIHSSVYNKVRRIGGVVRRLDDFEK